MLSVVPWKPGTLIFIVKKRGIPRSTTTNLPLLTDGPWLPCDSKWKINRVQYGFFPQCSLSPGCDPPAQWGGNTRQDPLSKEKIIKPLILIYFQNFLKSLEEPNNLPKPRNIRLHGLQYFVVSQMPSHPAAPVVFGWVVLAGAVGMAASALLRIASHQPGSSLLPLAQTPPVLNPNPGWPHLFVTQVGARQVRVIKLIWGNGLLERKIHKLSKSPLFEDIPRFLALVLTKIYQHPISCFPMHCPSSHMYVARRMPASVQRQASLWPRPPGFAIYRVIYL